MSKRPISAIRNFFLGNIPYTVTEAELLEFLNEGSIKIAEVKICRDKETQQPRGFGFATLASDETSTIEEAIDAFNGLDFHGRQLRADKANERPAKPPRERPARGRDYHETWKD